MDTQTAVTRLQDDFLPTVARSKILEWLDMVQNIMFNHDCHATLLYDTAQTFPFPYLKTTASTLEYPLTSTYLTVAPAINGYTTTVRSVADLYIQTGVSYGTTSTYQYTREAIEKLFVNPWYTGALSGLGWQRWPHKFVAKRGIENAKIIFPEDPGTHTDKFILECYLNAVPLTAETIPLSIDADEWWDAVWKGVVGYSEQVAYGKSDKWDQFKEVECKKFWGTQNKGSEFKARRIKTHV